MSDSLRIAGVQMDVRFADKESNLAAIDKTAREATAGGARLLIYPECVVTGYCFESLTEARSQAEPLDGPSVARLAKICAELDIHLVAGLLEAEGERVYNACVLVGPQGLVSGYRKIHLPKLGVDQFVTPGDRPFAVHAAGDVQVGMHICYDAAFPESARVMTLQGAELLALPTNWPPGAECTAAHVIHTRAMENHVYVAAVNRVGTERGFRFFGGSKICAPSGRLLVAAEHDRPAIIYAEIEPAVARNKRLVRVPGKHEINRLVDRRPDMYAPLVEPVAAPAIEANGAKEEAPAEVAAVK